MSYRCTCSYYTTITAATVQTTLGHWSTYKCFLRILLEEVDVGTEWLTIIRSHIVVTTTTELLWAIEKNVYTTVLLHNKIV